MTSLRRRLFSLLVIATGIIWLSAVLWIFLVSRSELEHALDTRLQEAAKMVHSLVANGNLTAASSNAPFQEATYERQLSCQIWSLDGRLVARSGDAPNQNMAQDTDGFSNRSVGGELWRVFTIVDMDKGMRVAVGDRIGMRDRLVRDLIAGLLAPAILILPLLGLLIWLSLGRGLVPLNAVAKDIAARDGNDMQPILSSRAPLEVRPLLDALNSLLIKVETAQRHEKEITAFAAHELRTPLAGLKTQAQIALTADDPEIRTGALRQILISVDRASRLVRQLLTLTRLESDAEPLSLAKINVGHVVRDVIRRQSVSAGQEVTIAPALDTMLIETERDSLDLIIRNLHENAVEHTDGGSHICWKALEDGRGLVIEDDGSGIPENELSLVTRRFYRGTRKSTNGTGLGLTIAEMAARRLGAELKLKNLPGGRGLSAEIIWRPYAGK
jgi:two-component system sensor histidine kinase QseC